MFPMRYREAASWKQSPNVKRRVQPLGDALRDVAERARQRPQAD